MNEEMTQNQRLDYLVEEFKTDSVQYKDLETPKDTEGKRRILRSLMNIRIIDCFNEGARNTEIKNIKQYMKAVIFNAPTTIDSYYASKVRHDMPWLGRK